MKLALVISITIISSLIGACLDYMYGGHRSWYWLLGYASGLLVGILVAL